MKKLVFLFPGQGAQYSGMGKDFADHFEIARHTFEEADDILGENLSRIIFEGPEEELTLTKNSQTAIFVMSAAVLKTLQSQISDLTPSICSGLSLGEYTALWASGRLSFKETLLLVRQRARLMHEACLHTEGTMAAVLGMGAPELEAAVRGISGLWVANYNCPGQIVISGTKAGVEAGSAALKAAGAKRVIPLQVAGAFHSGLMQRAQDGLTPFIDQIEISESDVGYVMNVPGNFVSDRNTIKKNLAQQVTCSVRWEQGISAIEKTSPDLYLEIGCGKTLAGLNKKIGAAAPLASVDKIGDMDAAVKQIQGLSCGC